MKKKMFSIILPIYGNEKNLPITIPYIMQHLDLFPNYEIEIIMVCDGSPDNSWEVMKEMKKKYPDIIRNFRLNQRYSQQAAILCGFEQAKGDILGTIAADLQEPFELFADLLKKYEEGYKLVAGCREDRKDFVLNSFFAKLFHHMLHSFNSKYPVGGFDIFLMDRSLLDIFGENISKWGSMQYGMINMTDSIAYVGYTRRARKIGRSGYSLKRKIYIVITTLVLNTDKLFLFFLFFGVMVVFLSTIFIIISIILASSLLSTLFGIAIFMAGVIASGVGMLGISLYNWAQILRRLPKYIIEESD